MRKRIRDDLKSPVREFMSGIWFLKGPSLRTALEKSDGNRRAVVLQYLTRGGERLAVATALSKEDRPDPDTFADFGVDLEKLGVENTVRETFEDVATINGKRLLRRRHIFGGPGVRRSAGRPVDGAVDDSGLREQFAGLIN
jgi:hypothetical protein